MTEIKYFDTNTVFGLKWWEISDDQIRSLKEFDEPTKCLTMSGISKQELDILRKWFKKNRDYVSVGHIQEFEDSDVEDRINNEIGVRLTESKFEELCQLLTNLPTRDHAAKVYFKDYTTAQSEMKKYSEEYNIKFFGEYDGDKSLISGQRFLDDYYIVSGSKEDLFALFLHWEHECEMLDPT